MMRTWIALCVVTAAATSCRSAPEPQDPMPTTQPAIAAPTTQSLAQRRVTFDHPDGPFTKEIADADFGNGGVSGSRAFGSIVDGALRVGFNAGKKVTDTGYAAHIRVPRRDHYSLSFRLRFPDDFEAGLHGKQMGMSGGRGYDGGRGQPARENGDGWSIRLQFDSSPDVVTNTLYVYHQGMAGTYGGPMGSKPFPMQRGRWYDIRLAVTMQSAPDASDGRIEVFCDGQKKIDVPSVRFVRVEDARHIDRIRVEVFPGGGGAFPSRDTFIELDDIHWTDQR
jgi:hypothetical protein